MNVENRVFKTDSEGASQEIPTDSGLAPGQIRQNLATGELELALDDGSLKHFYIDYQGHRVLNIDTNEWTQLDPLTSPHEFILGKVNNK